MAQERLANFEEICQLGEGSFGTVYKVRHRKTKDIYVLKKISTVGMTYQDRADARQEFMIHKTLKCDYIVKYESHFNDKNFICILLEFMDNGDLGQYLKKTNGKLLAESKVWWFFIQTCLGIQYLHARRILHRDLKTINLFLNKDETLKIGDLGVAKEVKESHTHTIVGTPYYLSPELCEEKPYNSKSDIWSLGCILYELCTLKHPFDAKTQGGLFLKIIKESYEPISDYYSKELADLIAWCLQKNYKDRPSIQQILENEKLQEEACNLSLIIPTEDEIKGHISTQKTDFMTTFAKKKAGSGGARRAGGGMGLVSNNRLKKHAYDPKAPSEKPKVGGIQPRVGGIQPRVGGIQSKVGADRQPKPRSQLGGHKYKVNSKSDNVDVNKIANDAVSKIDNLLNPSSRDQSKVSNSSKSSQKSTGSSVPSIYQKHRKYSPRTRDKGNLNDKSKVSNVSGSSNISNQPKSKYEPKRNYKKPWQRPSTAGTRPENNLKKEIETKAKEDTRKKANDIVSKRKQFKPAIMGKKKSASPESRNKNEIGCKLAKDTFDIEVEQLETDMADMKQHAPEPYPNSAGVVLPHRASPRGIRKLNSADVNKAQIPLKNIEGDDEQCETRPEAKVVSAFLKSEDAPQLQQNKSDIPKRASKMIGDIKKKMKSKHTNKPINNDFVDETTGITMDTHTEDVHLVPSGYVDEVEEVKNSSIPNVPEDHLEFNNSGNSKSSSHNSVNLVDGEEDEEIEAIDLAFKFEDDNFDIDEFDGKSPLDNVGLDEIKEDEEIYDEFTIQKREIKQRLAEIESDIDQRWKQLISLSDEKKAEECYEFFKTNISDADDINEHEKMEKVHKYIKKQEVKNYRSFCFECFKLFSSYQDLEDTQEELDELEESK